MADQSQNQKRRDLTTVITWLTALRALYPGGRNLEPETAREYATLALEVFPVTLFTDRARHFVVRQCSYYPSPKELVDALKEHQANLEREKEQRSALDPNSDFMKRMIWAHKVLERRPLYDRPYEDDAYRVAREFRDKHPSAYQDASKLKWTRREREAKHDHPGQMPLGEAIERVAKHLEPAEAKTYRALMAIPTAQRSEEQRDTIFALVRTMLKRAGITGPLADLGDKIESTSLAERPTSQERNNLAERKPAPEMVWSNPNARGWDNPNK